MYKLEMEQISDEFKSCWRAAAQHLKMQVQDPLPWLKANLNPPFLEHLSFRIGNQLFYVRLEDVDGKLKVPGSRAGLMRVADGCLGCACLMPMRRDRNGWSPAERGWGLIAFETGHLLDPVALVSDERIEMTDWELHDFGVQIVRDKLDEQGKKLITWQSDPFVDPSIWFVGDLGPEWVVVRAVRYPRLSAEPPDNWREIAERCAGLGTTGHFAPVSFASTEDAFDPEGIIPATPLWRGHGVYIRYEGIAAVP